MFCPKCGGNVDDHDTFCRSCGTRLSVGDKAQTSVVEPPVQRRIPVTKWILMLLVCAALIVWWETSNNKTDGADGSAVAYCCKPATNDGSQTAATPASPEQTQAAQPVADGAQSAASAKTNAALPKDESQFISAITSLEAAYSEAPNEFQKSTIRKQRAVEIGGILPTRNVTNWTGEVAEMHTTSDGRGVLSIKLPGELHIEVETVNNGLSDIGEDTLIPQGSPLYNQIAHLAVGDNVLFSGTFQPGDRDYIEEVSITEEGSMTDPDFIFGFANVSKINP